MSLYPRRRTSGASLVEGNRRDRCLSPFVVELRFSSLPSALRVEHRLRLWQERNEARGDDDSHDQTQDVLNQRHEPRQLLGLQRRARPNYIDDKKLFCRDPTFRRGSSDSASLANCTEFTTGTTPDLVKTKANQRFALTMIRYAQV